VGSVRFRSGGVTFAAVIAAVIGLFNILSGIAAIAEDDQTEAIGEVLYGVDITAWGWFWLIIGALQLLTAVLIFQRSPAGQVLGIAWAAITAVLSVFLIFVAPIWSLVVITLSVTVIFALTAYPDEFGEGGASGARRG
jgi:succinate-acetate transporter protein